MSFIVGIDGPAGSGKGTIAKNISDILDFTYVDTGVMYRCVTLYMLRNDIKPDEDEKIKSFIKNDICQKTLTAIFHKNKTWM